MAQTNFLGGVTGAGQSAKSMIAAKDNADSTFVVLATKRIVTYSYDTQDRDETIIIDLLKALHR